MHNALNVIRVRLGITRPRGVVSPVILSVPLAKNVFLINMKHKSVHTGTTQSAPTALVVAHPTNMCAPTALVSRIVPALTAQIVILGITRRLVVRNIRTHSAQHAH